MRLLHVHVRSGHRGDNFIGDVRTADGSHSASQTTSDMDMSTIEQGTK